MQSKHPFGRILAGFDSPLRVFAVAFFIRMVAAAQLVAGHPWQGFYQPNEATRIAWAMVSGFGFSSPWPGTPLAATAQQPPLYPFVLAGIFKLAGTYSFTSLWIAISLNAFLAALSAVLIFRLGSTIFGSAAGVMAAWVWAGWVYEVAVSIRIWESTLSTLLLLIGLSMLWRVADSHRLREWMGFGALAGFASLSNTTLLAVFLCFWGWLGIRRRRKGASFARLLLASMAVCALVMVPWTIRNYRAFHRLFPVRDNLGLELWVGNHPGVTHLYQFDRDFPLLDPAEFDRLGEVRFMQQKREIALQFIQQHPGKFLQLSAERFFDYWTTPKPYLWIPISLLSWIGGLIGVRHKRMDAVPFVIVLSVYPLIYYFTHTWSTYRHPSEPEILMLAAYAVVAAVEAAKRTGPDRIIAAPAQYGG
jgi:hypothetical protein